MPAAEGSPPPAAVAVAAAPAGGWEAPPAAPPPKSAAPADVRERLRALDALPRPTGRAGWAADAEKRMKAAADALNGYQAVADRRLFDTNPDVARVCEALDKRSRLGLAEDALLAPGAGLVARLGGDASASRQRAPETLRLRAAHPYGCLGPCGQLVERALGDQPPVADHDHLVHLWGERGKRPCELAGVPVRDHDRRNLHAPSISR